MLIDQENFFICKTKVFNFAILRENVERHIIVDVPPSSYSIGGKSLCTKGLALSAASLKATTPRT